MCPRGGGGWEATEAALARKLTAVAERASSQDHCRRFQRRGPLHLPRSGGFVETTAPPLIAGQPHDVDADWVRQLESLGWVAIWSEGDERWVDREFHFTWQGSEEHAHRRAAAVACAVPRDLHGATEDDWWHVEVHWPYWCGSSAFQDANTWTEVIAQQRTRR